MVRRLLERGFGFVRARLQEIGRAVLFVVLLVRYFAGPLLRRWLRLAPRGPSSAVRLRKMIERMGISFVKLGQFLAMRFDIIPPEYCRELDRLFEDAPVLSERAIRRRIESELGRPIAEAFRSFDGRPLAAASIAQVHRAVTHDGLAVAVKVQRPRIREIFRADMRILRRIAQLADLFRLLGRIRLHELVDEFARFTEREMNFLEEAETAEHVRASEGEVARVPFVRWDLTTARILTMEFVEGVSLLTVCVRAETLGKDSVRALIPGIDLDDVIERLAQTCLHQMFATGLFHGDPHPGNILVAADGRPVLLDFGIFGRLDQRTRTHLAAFYEALAMGRIEEAYRAYQDISQPSEDTDVPRYRRELVESLQAWYDITVSGYGTVQERHPLKFVTEIVNIMRRHAVRMPPDQLLFWRSLTTLASLALRVPVTRFDLVASLRRFFVERQPRLGERVRAALGPATMEAWTRLAIDAPGLVRRASAGAPRPLAVRTGDHPEDRRRRRHDAGLLALAALGTSAAVLLAALGAA